MGTSTVMSTPVVEACFDGVGRLRGEKVVSAEDTLAAIHGYDHPGQLSQTDWRDLYSTVDGIPAPEGGARESDRKRYETIVETIRDGVYVLDEDLRFTLVLDFEVETPRFSGGRKPTRWETTAVRWPVDSPTQPIFL